MARTINHGIRPLNQAGDKRILSRQPCGHVGEAIERELRRRGWSTYRLALEAGINRRATISDVLRGRITSAAIVNRVLRPLGLIYTPNEGGSVSSI